MKKIVDLVDKAIRKYLGINDTEVSPNNVKISKGNIIISSTESFKRHVYIQNWEEFNELNFKNTSSNNKEKLGIAIGKVIAKNLVISFDEMPILKE